MSSTPVPYNRQASFASFATPDAPTVGPNLEAEFSAVKLSSDQTQSRLAELQRDDGALRNGIVTPDALSAGSLTLVGGWVPRGAWITLREYAYKDLITKDGVSYVCLSAHQSGDFAIDLANNIWQILVEGADTPAPTAQEPLLFQDEGLRLYQVVVGAGQQAACSGIAAAVTRMVDRCGHLSSFCSLVPSALVSLSRTGCSWTQSTPAHARAESPAGYLPSSRMPRVRPSMVSGYMRPPSRLRMSAVDWRYCQTCSGSGLSQMAREKVPVMRVIQSAPGSAFQCSTLPPG